MVKRRSPGGPQRDVEAMATANACPEPLLDLATDRHRGVFAALLSSLPADQRAAPSVRALAAAAAGHVLALDELQRALDTHGATLDGKPSPLVNGMATLTAALIASLRAMRVLPAGDRRTLAA